MNTNELRVERARLIHEARHLNETAEKENRDLTAEETQQFDRHMDEAKKIEDRYTRIENLDAVEKSLGESRGRVTQPEKFAETRESGARPEVRKAWNRYLSDGAMEYRGLVADSNAAGGYLVAPLQFNEELIKTIDKLNVIGALARRFTLNGALAMGTPSLTKASDATWESEVNVSAPDTTLATGRRDLTPHKLSKLVKVSEWICSQCGFSDVDTSGDCCDKIWRRCPALKGQAMPEPPPPEDCDTCPQAMTPERIQARRATLAAKRAENLERIRRRKAAL